MIVTTTQDEMRIMALEWIPRQSHIVEVGCSSGNFAELIQRTEHRYTGIDILSDKIKEARKKFPDMNFVNCDIIKNLYMLHQATTVVSFQCLEHIKEDLKLIKEIPWGSIVIISVPNRKYKGHVRWFEEDGWTERFDPYITLNDAITIQHPKKPNNRSFLFRGIRNGNND